METLVGDLTVLCNHTKRDIEHDTIFNTAYYFTEINRIIARLNAESPLLFGDVSQVAFDDRAAKQLPTHMYARAKLLEINSVAEKLLLRVKPKREEVNAGFDSLATLERVFHRFHQVARQLRTRHGNRDTLDIGDEYDVQDLLHALLKLYFDDIRTEEWAPSYAGSSSRMDLLLKDEKLVIEVKKASNKLRDKEIGRQLIQDISHYKEHPDCKTLLCFIYDPEGMVGNPEAIIKDLTKNSTDDFQVKVFITPS